jgi:recombinational DNA repair ATPase RecF
MRFMHLKLENWRNFLAVNVRLQQRVFLVGPNASGKSNLLDAFRFLRDVADPQGGLQRAVVKLRGSVSQIRSLHARRYPTVAIEVEVGDGDSER